MADNIDSSLIEINLRFKDYLNSKEGILRCFNSQEVQLEGWFKGELLYFLSNLKDLKEVNNFNKEVKSPVSNQKIDFQLELIVNKKNEVFWLEIKHWLIGYQKGYKYNANSYFRDPTSVGIKPDVEKLVRIKSGNKYMLILTTANPGKEDWYNGIQKFNNKFYNLRIESLTDPDDFKDSYFLGLLKIKS